MLIVKDLVLGEGKPKICASMIGRTLSELTEEAKKILISKTDLAEWRVDGFEQSSELPAVLEALRTIKAEIKHKPLLLTFRTKEEGGLQPISNEAYLELYQTVIASDMVDMIDVQWQLGAQLVVKIAELAHKQGIKVLLSHHDFLKTPSAADLIDWFCHMQEMGGDIVKIAVMPQIKQDVLTLMEAALQMKAQCPNLPIVAIAMGDIGKISRIAAEWFGSALSFGALDEGSAPGQLPVEALSSAMQIIHESISIRQ